MSFRILLADDEALIRKDLSEHLEELGYQPVAAARDGEEALALVARHKPDVVMLDIKMPGKDGLEVARELAPEYPVIMLTAHSSPDLVRQARDHGVMAYITKPLRAQDIAPAVELAVTHFLREAKLGEKVRHLNEQLETRKLVDRAKALLMNQRGLSEVEAHRQMQQTAMQRNLNLRQVAQAVIERFA